MGRWCPVPSAEWGSFFLYCQYRTGACASTRLVHVPILVSILVHVLVPCVCMQVVSHSIGGVGFGFYGAREARKLSVKEITEPVLFDNLRNPVPGGPV